MNFRKVPIQILSDAHNSIQIHYNHWHFLFILEAYSHLCSQNLISIHYWKIKAIIENDFIDMIFWNLDCYISKQSKIYKSTNTYKSSVILKFSTEM